MFKKTKKNLPLVVIFGRTNVGKSTLFNRLTEKRHALVANIPGTTRDANIDKISWCGKEFELIDTGGIIDLQYLLEKKKKTDDIEAKVQKQASDYLKQANLVLFMVDGIAGITPHDKQMSLLVKKILSDTSKIVLVVNKTDSARAKREVPEFYKLALGEPIPVSSHSGSGTGDLLDLIVKKLKIRKARTKIIDDESEAEEKNALEEEKDNTIKVCLLGQPNVGKSSLLNALLGEDRVIVSPVAHTTREPQDTTFEYKGKKIKIVDTAGLSREGQKASKRTKTELKTNEDLVASGIAKSLGALNRADIALLVLDVNKTITHQDQSIMEEIIYRKKSVIIIANKWDLVPEKDTKKYTTYIYDNFPFAHWATIQFVSALTKEKIQKVMDLILQISEVRKKEIPASILNSFMMHLVKLHRPSKGRGIKYPRIHKFEQIKTNPPQFEMRIGAKEDLHNSYTRFVENRLREKFDIISTPLSIRVTKGRKVHGAHDTSEFAMNSEKIPKRN